VLKHQNSGETFMANHTKLPKRKNGEWGRWWVAATHRKPKFLWSHHHNCS